MAPNASYRRETWIAMGHLTGEMPEVCRGGNRRCDRIITNGIHAGQKLNRGKAGQYLTKSKGNTAQFVGSVGDAFSAICCLQIFRFTSSKPSKSAIASDEKFIRLRTNSFVRYCLKSAREHELLLHQSVKESTMRPHNVDSLTALTATATHIYAAVAVIALV